MRWKRGNKFKVKKTIYCRRSNTNASKKFVIAMLNAFIKVYISYFTYLRFSKLTKIIGRVKNKEFNVN